MHTYAQCFTIETYTEL